MSSHLPGSSTFILTELDDEIRRATNEEYLVTQSKMVTGMGLIRDEKDLEHEVKHEFRIVPCCCLLLRLIASACCYLSLLSLTSASYLL